MGQQHILLVEDEPDFRNSLRMVLQGERYRVDVAAMMAEAKQFLASTQYTLVISDWQLPDGDGTVILEWAAQPNSGRRLC
jgi:DNA-binding response OmpR family regulator